MYERAYNARTSKFLATTWRKFPEPISFRCYCYCYCYCLSLFLPERESLETQKAAQKALQKEIGKGSLMGTDFAGRIQWCTRIEAPNFRKSSGVMSTRLHTCFSRKFLPCAVLVHYLIVLLARSLSRQNLTGASVPVLDF